MFFFFFILSSVILFTFARGRPIANLRQTSEKSKLHTTAPSLFVSHSPIDSTIPHPPGPTQPLRYSEPTMDLPANAMADEEDKTQRPDLPPFMVISSFDVEQAALVNTTLSLRLVLFHLDAFRLIIPALPFDPNEYARSFNECTLLKRIRTHLRTCNGICSSCKGGQRLGGWWCPLSTAR